MASGSVLYTTRTLKRNVLELASHLLEANPDDLEVVDGVVRARDAAGNSVTLAEVAAAAYLASDTLPPDADPVLDVTQSYRPDETGGGWAATTHVCFVRSTPIPASSRSHATSSSKTSGR